MPQGVESVSKTFSQLIEDNQFVEVPAYQRRFSWRSERINQLWDDIVSLLAEPEEERVLFLGPTVLHIEDKQTFLVDGQQRMVTLSLAAAALKHRTKFLGSESEEEARAKASVLAVVDRLLFKGGRATKGVRLKLSAHDNDAFHDLLVNGTATNPPRRIKAAWTRLNQLVEDTLKGKDVANLEALAEIIAHAPIFAVVTVEDPCDPLSVFESLNSKGQPLVQSDLIKNRVLQVCPEGKRDLLEKKWNFMVAQIPEDQVTHFLRAWWISEKEFVSGRNLYREVRNHVKTAAQAAEFVRAWQEAAKHYQRLAGAAAPSGSPELKTALQDFSQLNFIQGRPILLALLNRGTTELVPLAVNHLARIFVRVLKTAQQRGSIFESKIGEICESIRTDPKQGVASLAKVADSLIADAGPIRWDRFHVDDDVFAKYLLRKIAQADEQKTWDATLTMEVEHIMPQTPSTEPLTDDDLEAYEDLVTHVGNLTLILDKDNPRCTNRPFDGKKPVYLEYRPNGFKQPSMTGRLAKEPKWSEAEIVGRAKQLAETAETIWPTKGASEM